MYSMHNIKCKIISNFKTIHKEELLSFARCGLWKSYQETVTFELASAG